MRGLRAVTLFAVFASFLTAGCFAKAAWIGPDDIGGVVTGPHGPEGGVWVIAQTRELGTPRYSEIVVTDGRGRFLLPDLPKAGYEVWARGYGIRDTAWIRARGGSVVNLQAANATPAEAAALYPGGYWYSMLKIPPAGAFSGAGRNEDIPAGVTRAEWINVMKQGTCVGCHQLGDEATRTIPHAFASAGPSEAQWVRRIESGQAGPDMIQRISTLGPLALNTLADWTDRIAAGQVPKAKPARPRGIERNIVITTWDWLDDKSYVHDAISTDARNPTVNAYGRVYGGTELSRLPGPSFESDPDVAVEASYYTWVDRFDTLGLGRDVPIVTGNELDCLDAFVGGRFVTMRVPYPLNFYAKGVDGRIDDPNAGWKGRGLWTATGDRTPWHHEGGKGDRPMVVHIQLRPNPLAD